MSRRAALLAGAALMAGAGGFGTALWQRRPSSAGAAAAALWSAQFDDLNGGRLAMQGFRGQPLLVNFWATWCPPCVRELPLLDRFQRDHAVAGWRVVGIAIDNLEPVRRFLVQHPVTFAVGLAGAGGIELAKALGNASGTLPFSVIVAGNGGIVVRHRGAIEPADLASWADSVA